MHILEQQLFNIIRDTQLSEEERVRRLKVVIDGITMIRKKALEDMPNHDIIVKVMEDANINVNTQIELPGMPTINVNTENTLEWTPLMDAACLNKAGCVQALIEAGADVRMKSSRNSTALIYAAGCNAVESLKVLSVFKDTLEIKDSDEETAFLNLNFGTDNLCEAAKVLIDAGVDVEAKDSHGNTLLDKCFEDSNFYNERIPKLVGMLVSVYPSDKYLLRNAACTGRAELVKAVIDAGVNHDDFHAYIAVKNTVDRCFSRRGDHYDDEGVLKTLINAGIGIKYKDENGKYPLVETLIGSGKVSLVAAAIKQGAVIEDSRSMRKFLNECKTPREDIDYCNGVLEERFPLQIVDLTTMEQPNEEHPKAEQPATTVKKSSKPTLFNRLFHKHTSDVNGDMSENYIPARALLK